VTDLARSRLRIAAAVLLGLALLAPAAFAGAALSGHPHRWPDLLAQFVGPALVMSAGLLVGAVLLRSRALCLAAVIVCGLVLLAGSRQWATPRGEPEPGSPTLTLYSANLHIRNDDVEAMAASIAASDADLIVLVEVGPAPSAALDQVLAGYPHRVISGRTDRPLPSRSLIASRYPLAQIPLRIPGLHIVAAHAETPLGPITVAGPHFTRPWPYQIQWEQIRQAEGLAGWTRSVEGPVLAAGDFNSVSSGRIGRIVQEQGDLLAAPGWPGTWPANLPAFASLTIDQVYRSPELALIERRLGRPTGSDHRPVITRFVKAAPPAS
jgi:endonuclease/exonuclease/phosphatase (EEP) superfamily protein YafD